MYKYDDQDQQLLDERVAQFRDQTNRFLNGTLADDAYRTLRLMNGVYIQKQAPMLRVAVPYGLFSSVQLRKVAQLAQQYDKGYVHFTTRQNIQFNWPKLEDIPNIEESLASVQMHAIQTSGNCIRNTTSDHFAGIAPDEIEDPRPYCEIIRRWSILHPEFAYLPRKFKIAVSGATNDRAATQLHDIGLYLKKNAKGETGFEVLVGGGLGRTPIIGKTIKPFLSQYDLLSYLEAILRVYNQYGRRDNMYKARIKILVKSMGVDVFGQKVEAEWEHIKDSELKLDDQQIELAKAHFPLPAYITEHDSASFMSAMEAHSDFANWIEHNTDEHKNKNYKAVTVSLKAPSAPPGDITTEQMNFVADLADEFSFGLLRSTHRQNLILSDVAKDQLHPLWLKLKEHNLATANIGTLTDSICCPGLEFCSLANASTIPLSEELNKRFDDLDYLYDLGPINLNISGCMNACGHQDVGHIGILGVDKKGVEWYQITIGGSSSNDAYLGDRLGRAVPRDQIINSIEKIIQVYVSARTEEESFLETYRRIGITPFKEKVYANN
ncbi:Sulfite reductase [NADPH] hemoprotein beta-component [hydrothermal vent metagenome]|uniref:Sulfite reductase [NADPH] hemoprotein beta-component n=1 Tax=hydrothermal vent metagenome TaxID=652676 RepID=A0A3B1A3G1_9ZZZZ